MTLASNEKRRAKPGSIKCRTSEEGPPAIQGEADGIAATKPLLSLVENAGARLADGIIIGCFDDTALADASAFVSCPVVGIGHAAFHYCALSQWRISAIITLSVSVPIIEGNVSSCGLSGLLGRVLASEIPVLELERRPESAAQTILTEAQKVLVIGDVSAIVLGFAGMVQSTEAMRASLPC